MIFRKLILVVTSFCALTGYAQSVNRSNSVKEISYDELLTLINTQAIADDKHVLIEDKIIYWKKSNDDYIYNSEELQLPDFARLKGSRMLWFRNCTFKLNFVWFDHQKALLYRLWFQGCTFDGQFALLNMNCIKPPAIENCNFNEFLDIESMHIYNDDYDAEFTLEGCRLKYCQIAMLCREQIRINVLNNNAEDSTDFRLSIPKISSAQFGNNKFPNKNVHLSLKSLDILKFNDNHFNNLILNSNINSEFDLVNTTIVGKFLMWESSFESNPLNDIEMESISDYKLGIFKNREEYQPTFGYWRKKFIGNKIEKFDKITGESNEQISSNQSFKEVIGWYSMFLNSFKSSNDLESYNSCFIQVKELQSKRLAYLYESNPTFEKYFRWKLSQLLKFYVRYGTDPARAIVISIYIIACFGLFFFFFPSDWDTTSKSKLIQNFKDFMQKNEKGYVKPFFILLLGFIVSLINAFTLSLNAFITLGFGNIPTHGIARYFCVLEGFLGWFLLSIFTVAMINQVL